MAHAETCPLCNGIGTSLDICGNTTTCHGCDGAGWVSVEDAVPFQTYPLYPDWEYLRYAGFNSKTAVP